MKNYKLFKTLLVLIGILIGSVSSQMWADRTYDGTEKLYITNCKPYYREENQDKTWSDVYTNSSARIYAYFYKGKSNATVEVSLSGNVFSGTDRTEGCIYAINVPAGTWSNVILVRGSTSDWSSSSWDTNKWNQTGDIPLSSDYNLIKHFKINDAYCDWGYVPMTVSAGNPVYVYYDNSNTNWADKIQFMVGHSGYGRAYPLTKLAGTKLAYRNLNDVYNGAWTDATYYAVAQKSDDLTLASGTSNYDYSFVTSNATHYTAAYRNRNAFNLSANNTFLCTTSTGNDGTAWDIEYKSGGYSDLNNTQTIYKSLNNSTSSADIGTVSITTTKLTGNVTGSENNSTATIGTSASSANTDAVITATVTLAASAKNGYVFDGWATSANGEVIDGSNVSSWTYTANTANSYYAKFHYASYTVTLDPDNGSSSESVSATYNTAMPSTKLPSGTLTAPTWSNYTFQGYFDDHAGSGTQYYTNTVGSAHVWDKTSTATLYAKWTASITLDDNGGTANGSVTVTYKGSAGTPSAPTYAGKVLTGYYAAADGDNLIMDKDGTLHANKDGYTDEDGKWIGAGDAVLYAHWTDHTWALYYNSRANKLGDLTSRGGNVYTLNCNIVNGTNNSNWSFLMDGETIYHYGAESPIGNDRTLTSGEGQLNWQGASYGWYTIKVFNDNGTWKYRADASPEISFTASPTGGSVTAEATLEGTIDSGDHITYNTDVTFTATPGTGYTFEGWYTNDECTIAADNKTDNPLTVSGVTSATGRYAKFAEDTKTLVPTVNSWGTTAGYSASATNSGTIGVATTTTLTCSDATTGFSFSNWTLTNLTVTAGSSTSTSVTVKITDPTQPFAAVANYAEDYSTPYVIKGGTAIAGGEGWDVELVMRKRTGHTTEPIAYDTITLSGATPSGAQTSYNFKIVQKSTDSYWGIATDNHSTDWQYYRNYGVQTLSTGGGVNDNIQLHGDMAGDYIVKVDYSDDENPTVEIIFPINGRYNVTLTKSGHGSVANEGTLEIHQEPKVAISATPEAGYRFVNWTVDSDHSSYISFDDENSASTNVYATSASAEGATITANFTNDGIIYLDKSAISGSWGGTPYVYFYSMAYWDTSDAKKGSGSKTGGGVTVYGPYAMTRIGSSQIWYYDYHTTPGTGTTKQYVAFNDHSQASYNNFVACLAIYRGDFYQKQNMFVVKDYKYYYNTSAAEGQAVYYNDGYWRKYNDTDPGYVIKTYNGFAQGSTLTGTYHLSSDERGERNCTVDIPLNSGTNYFKVVGCDTTTINDVSYTGTYYRDASDGTMSTDNCTNWYLTDGNGSNTGVLATASADYKFTLTLGEGSLYISVEFPMAVGDFRLMYDGKMRTTYLSKKKHPSNFIRKLKAPVVAADTTRKDTISFFIDPVEGDLAPDVYFQWCSNIDGYTITWRDTLAGSKPSLSGITKAGVYDFIVTQTTTKAGAHSISCAYEGAYKGKYYIRTNKAAGGWKSYKVTKDNQVVYSQVSKKFDFDYYYCNWFNAGDNVKFTIANDYNECVSDTVENDEYVTQTGANVGKLSYSANVRFMYNDSTNVITRAYINGSKESNRYLVLTGDAKTFNADGSDITGSGVLNDHELEFDDKGNWVYQKDLKAQTGSEVSVTANYNGNTQTLIDAQTLITTTGEDTHKYKLRTVYDFKTNQLVAAWLPDTEEEIDEDLTVTADMMLIRRGQNAADQIHFNGGSISDIKTMVGAIEFFKDSIVGRVSNFNGDEIGASGNRAFRELMLYISFPFDVAVNDIYGFGQLNREWYLQYYDGAERASKGFFKGDGTTTFWKFMTLSDTLRANVGYSLLLDNDYFNTNGSGVWKNIANGESIYLYFPSVKELDGDSIISSTTKTLKVPSHECTIDRPFTSNGRPVNHKFTDSHWNMLGMPLFENQTGVATSKFVTTKSDSVSAFVTDKGYFYEWDSLANTLSVRATTGYTFKSMHGYMVQFSGSIDFSGSAIHTKPASIVARRAPKNEENYTLELQLLQNNQRVSRAYIELRDEACDTFALNEDVYMIYTSLPADLFTYAGNYDVSANVLSVGNHTIPVGIEVHKAGSYTFSMPENFSGAATLIDTQTGARTNLALSDYTVTLPKGVCDGRFYIEIDLNKMPTAIDGVEGGSLKDGKAHKFIENGIMYILRDGILYDARGNKVK